MIDDFYNRLAEILDVEQVAATDVLRDFDEWDSLTALSVLAMCDSQYNVTLSSEELASALTAEELKNIIDAKARK